MMKKLFTIAALSLGLAGSFNPLQADYCCNYSTPCCPGRFNGFYVGGNVGWTFHDRTWVDRDAWVDEFGTDFTVGSIVTSFNGVSGGLQAGYNMQCGNALFGFEVDGSWADLSRTRTYEPTAIGTTILTLKDNINWIGTLRGRVGIIANDVLLYVTAGAALDYTKHTWTVAGTTTESFGHNHTRWGLALGTGAEWAFSECITIKLEGIYCKFPETSHSFVSAAAGQTVRFDLINETLIARLGINFKIY